MGDTLNLALLEAAVECIMTLPAGYLAEVLKEGI